MFRLGGFRVFGTSDTAPTATHELLNSTYAVDIRPFVSSLTIDSKP